MPSSLPPSRRALLAGAALSFAPALVRAQGGIPQAGPAAASGTGAEPRPLAAQAARARLKPEPAPETPVWAFDGRAAPPVIRVKLGEAVRLRLENKTEKPLSLHWHGVRNRNAMDGVGGVTQARSPRARASSTSSPRRMPGPS